MKVTFKKHPRETGLAAVGHPHSSVDIKINKKTFGLISPPSWQTKGNMWSIQVAVVKAKPDNNPNCPWEWIYLKKQFDDEATAKIFIQTNIEKLVSKYTLHFFEN